VEDFHYRKLFQEIVDGYSSCSLFGKRGYIKHQRNKDIVDFEIVYDDFFEKAQSKGLPTNNEITIQLNEEGIWTKEDDKRLDSKISFCESLISNKKNIVLKSAIDSINQQIQKAQKEVDELKFKKDQLFLNSCEKYALNRSNDFFVHKSFFKDKSFSELFFLEEDFEYLTPTEVTKLVSQYNKHTDFVNEKNIQKLAVQPFYKMYYSFSESCSDFYGASIVETTLNQLNLLLYTRIFKNIFEQNENIPERIMNDPEALLDFANSSESRENLKSKLQNNDSAGSTVFGATEEDIENLGLQSSQTKSLSKTAKEKGGSLNMKDLMDLSGI